MRLSLKGRIFVAVVWSACMASVVFGEEGSAKARPSVLLGATFSTGLGEQKYAPFAELRLDSGPYRISTQGELSKKVESSAGYRVSGTVERTFGPVIAEVSGHYRNGGIWSKASAWIGVGVGTRDMRLIARHELPLSKDLNDVYSLALVLARGKIEWKGEVFNFRQTFSTKRSTGGVLSLGLRLGER